MLVLHTIDEVVMEFVGIQARGRLVGLVLPIHSALALLKNTSCL